MPIFLKVCLIGVFYFASQCFAVTGEKITDTLIKNGANIEYQKQIESGSQQIVLSAPKRINNELVIEKDRRIEGKLSLVLLKLPPSLTPSEAFHSIELLLSDIGKLEFRCQQRACGVSSYWANNIFDERRLTGRDSDQYYIAGTVALPESRYIVTIYFVTNALRQNLAYITYITQPSELSEWENGFLLSNDFAIPEAVSIAIKQQIEANPSLSLFLAAYVDGKKFNTLSKMEAAVQAPFVEAQAKLEKSLSISAAKIRMQFVGGFHSQIPVDGEQVWFRLFLY